MSRKWKAREKETSGITTGSYAEQQDGWRWHLPRAAIWGEESDYHSRAQHRLCCLCDAWEMCREYSKWGLDVHGRNVTSGQLCCSLVGGLRLSIPVMVRKPKQCLLFGADQSPVASELFSISQVSRSHLSPLMVRQG